MLLVHLSIRTPAQEQEGGDDEEPADDGGRGEALVVGEKPLDDCDEEDG